MLIIACHRARAKEGIVGQPYRRYNLGIGKDHMCRTVRTPPFRFRRLCLLQGHSQRHSKVKSGLTRPSTSKTHMCILESPTPEKKTIVEKAVSVSSEGTLPSPTAVRKMPPPPQPTIEAVAPAEGPTEPSKAKKKSKKKKNKNKIEGGPVDARRPSMGGANAIPDGAPEFSEQIMHIEGVKGRRKSSVSYYDKGAFAESAAAAGTGNPGMDGDSEQVGCTFY